MAFLKGLVPAEGLLLGHAAVQIDVRDRVVTLDDGRQLPYDGLVSTIPLHRLVEITGPARLRPAAIEEAAARLAWTSVLLVDVALNRPDATPYTWFYIYDEDLPAARVSAPSLLSPSNTPAGMGSLQLEIYYSKSKPLPGSPDTLTQVSLDQLERMGLVDVSSDVVWARHRAVEHANVLFDQRRAHAVTAIRRWAAKRNIVLAGRYGLWEYLWSDGAVRSGYAAAEALLARR